MCYLLLSGGDVLQLSDALIDGVVAEYQTSLPEKYIFTYKNNI